ncbi:hypothetical protein RyT2_18250 [Pseudolactococcus yaeyamensis]
MGCSQIKKIEKTDTNEKVPKYTLTNTTPKTNYAQKTITLPDGMTHIFDLKVDEKDKIRIAVTNSNQDKISIYDSQDKGGTWQEVVTLTDEFKALNIAFLDVRLGTGNRAVIDVRLEEHDDEQDGNHDLSGLPHKIFYVDSQNRISEAPKTVSTTALEVGTVALDWISDTELLAVGEEQLGIINAKTGNFTQIVKERIQSSAEKNGFLYVVTDENQLQKIDLAKKKIISLDKNFQVVTKILQTDKTSNPSFSLSSKTDDILYLNTPDNIIEINGEESSVLMKKKGLKIGSPGSYLETFVPIGAEDFIALVNGESICYYTPTDEVVVKEKEKLKIFALKNVTNGKNFTLSSQELEEVIFEYENRYPDIDVELTYGTTQNLFGGFDVALDDALRLFNTQIVAGDAPDIVVLDNLNAQKYIDKGMLVNLSDIVTPLSSKDYFMSAFEAYKQNDKYYGLPLSFSATTALTKGELQLDTSSLNRLTKSVLALSDKKENTIFISDFSLEMISGLYRYYISKVPQQIDRKEIEMFYQNIESLYQTFDKKEVEVLEKRFKEEHGGWLSKVDAMPVFSNPSAWDILSFNALLTIQNFGTPSSTLEMALLKSVGYSLEGLGKKNQALLIPHQSLAILKTSQVQSLARDFIASSLKPEVQKTFNSNAPVSKIAYRDIYQANVIPSAKVNYPNPTAMIGEGENQVKATVPEINDKMIEEWVDYLDKVKIPSIIDDKVFRIIIENLDDIVEEKTTAKVAADKAYQKLQLYLAE